MSEDRICNCGCGAKVPGTWLRNYIPGHDPKDQQTTARKCACGCGMPVSLAARFVRGHNDGAKAPARNKRSRMIWLEEQARKAL